MSRSLALIFLSAICCLSVSAQPSQNIIPIQSHVYDIFNISERDTIYNGNTYRLYIAQPKGAENLAQKSPVLYMLDGNGQFPVMVNQIKETRKGFPIIVAIGYPKPMAFPKERTRDYTIPVEGNEEGGGAENFYQFIVNIVKPLIEKEYNVDTTRQTICGHSHGGLFVLYTAFNHTSTFQNYLAASPSIWWGNGKIIPQSRPLFSILPKSITITLGEYEENPSLDKTSAKKPYKNQRKSDISARDLYQLISKGIPNSRFILYEGKNHGSSVPNFLEEAIHIATNDKSVE